MTIQLREAPVATSDASAVARSLPPLGEPARLRLAGTASVVIGALLLGFFVQYVGVSQLSYARDQSLAIEQFRYDLANATAPVGQVGPDSKLLEPGTPVALLEIPVIRVREVVLEGTTSSTTVSGPAHRRDTPLPGQAGASVVYGRQASYGAPFGNLSLLRKGDRIVATTGQGEATYRVTGVRYTGDSLPEPMEGGEGRLTLVSAAGVPYIPNTIIRVDARLTSEAQPSPGKVIGYAALDANELTMAGDTRGWPLLVLGLILLFVTLALFTVSRRFWGKWQTWIVAVPVLLTLGSFTAQQVAVLLPNVI